MKVPSRKPLPRVRAFPMAKNKLQRINDQIAELRRCDPGLIKMMAESLSRPFGPNHFILLDRIAVPCDFMTWAGWFEESSRDGEHIVKQEVIHGVYLSTVFLGLDHGFGHGLKLFETMAFYQTERGDDTWRHTTWKEAADFHEYIASDLRAKLGPMAEKSETEVRALLERLRPTWKQQERK